jgi:hypothetical protein
LHMAPGKKADALTRVGTWRKGRHLSIGQIPGTKVDSLHKGVHLAQECVPFARAGARHNGRTPGTNVRSWCKGRYLARGLASGARVGTRHKVPLSHKCKMWFVPGRPFWPSVMCTGKAKKAEKINLESNGFLVFVAFEWSTC